MPIVLGSDGAGVVDRVGPGVDPAWVGAEVVINPSVDWGYDPRVQGERYRILGMPDNGTQAEFVREPEISLARGGFDDADSLSRGRTGAGDFRQR